MVGNPSTADERNPDLASLVLGRLAAPGSEGRTWREAHVADAERVLNVAQDWQQIGSRAFMWEMGGALYGAGRDRAYEVAGRMAAVGEQFGLAFSAAVEASFWREAVDSAPTKEAAHMGWRAMTELMTYYIMGASHGLINVAARTLAFDSNLRDRIRAIFPTALPVFSEEKTDSLSFNAKNVGGLFRIAKEHPSPSVAALIGPLKGLAADPDWRALEQARGKDFHRWRPQSISRLPQVSPWTQEGETWKMSFPGQLDSDVDDLARQRGLLAETVLGKLATAMDDFGTLFSAASEVLGGPRFKRASP